MYCRFTRIETIEDVIQWFNASPKKFSWKEDTKFNHNVASTQEIFIVRDVKGDGCELLHKNNYGRWLRGNLDEVLDLLESYPASGRNSYAVSKEVNRSEINKDQLIEPVR